MKVNGPPQLPNPGVSGSTSAERPNQLDEASRAREPSETGKTFGEKLQTGASAQARPLAGAAGPTKASAPGAVPRSGEIAVSDLAEELRAGKLASSAAIEKVLERVVAKQLGPDAPAGVRDQVRTALRDAIDGDPLLAEKLTQLQ